MGRKRLLADTPEMEAKRAADRRYYHAHKHEKSICLDSVPLTPIPEPLPQPPEPVTNYQNKGVKTFKNCGGGTRDTVIYFQVIQFNCPHCQTIIEKNIPVQGWRLILFCKTCQKQYQMDVAPLTLSE